MEKLLKSASNFSLAMPLFGIQQMASLLNRDEEGEFGNKAAMAMDDLTQAALGHCGETAKRSFESGNRFQQQFIEVLTRAAKLGEQCSKHASFEEEVASENQTYPRDGDEWVNEQSAHSNQQMGWDPVGA